MRRELKIVEWQCDRCRHIQVTQSADAEPPENWTFTQVIEIGCVYETHYCDLCSELRKTGE